MYRKVVFTLYLFLFAAGLAGAEETSSAPAGPAATVATNAPPDAGAPAEPGAKTLKGMSVLGNNEAPMSLVIVSWKGSELGGEANLTRTLNERDQPVDREVFLREVEFYQVSVGKN